LNDLTPILNRVTCGDCLEVMATMPESSVDTIITDPPYGLSFMGKEWDHGVPGAEFWQAALRVAKPGTILMAFGGTRTYHRLTCAIEDAGWEIRDCMLWLYGSGFPKSLDISKAIDKVAGAEREVVGCRSYSSSDIRGNSSNGRGISGPENKDKDRLNIPITAPSTPEAQLWHGWGTALKPAWEPIVIAMKPLDGTFANNALTHGVAGMWIDGSRVGTTKRTPGYAKPQTRMNTVSEWNKSSLGLRREVDTNSGRFPANLILDEEAGALLDEQSGVSKGQKSGGKKERNSHLSEEYWEQGGGGFKQGRSTVFHSDSGGASRFFYCSKASRKERNRGLPDGEVNRHPTVKPLKLMEYLCTLTKTPTGGIVLDPFCGSGSTLVAAQITGRQYIGIDIDNQSCDTARHRLQGDGLFAKIA